MKKTLLATAILLASAGANAAWTSADGTLTIGGDAEINFDAVRNAEGINAESVFAANEEERKKKKGKTLTQLNDDSRIKMAVEWKNIREDGAYLSAKIEPLMHTDGTVNVDDAYFMFGHQNGLALQLGRYEAMDLFPMGKDVAAFYAEGADSIGKGIYYYMAKEARGRAGSAGQARVISEMGNWTAEVSTIYGDTQDILQGSSDSDGLDSDSNSFMVRPAVNYLNDDGTFSVSFGGEYEMNDDSVVLVRDPADKEYDINIADRYGMAATTTLTFGELQWNTSIAMQDTKLWKAKTFNTNIVYKNTFGLGGSYAINEFDSEYVEDDAEDAKSYVIYTAYTMPILDFSNAEVTFALSYSDTENAYGKADANEQTTAFRTRFNYYF